MQLDTSPLATSPEASNNAGEAAIANVNTPAETKLGENIPPSAQPDKAAEPVTASKGKIDDEMAKAIAALDAKMTPMSEIIFEHGKAYTLTAKRAGQPGGTRITGVYDGDMGGNARFKIEGGETAHTSIPRTAIALVEGLNQQQPATSIRRLKRLNVDAVLLAVFS